MPEPIGYRHDGDKARAPTFVEPDIDALFANIPAAIQNALPPTTPGFDEREAGRVLEESNINSWGPLIIQHDKNIVKPPQAFGTTFTPSTTKIQDTKMVSLDDMLAESRRNKQNNPLTGNSSQQTSNAGTGGLFGGANNQNTTQPSGGLFGNTQQQSQPQQTGGLFGSTTNTQNATQPSGGLFGNTQNQNTTTGSSSIFGGGNTQNQNSSTTAGLFGGGNNQSQSTSNTGGLFGNTQNTTQGGGGLFGNTQSNAATGGSLFGNTNNQNSGGIKLGSNNLFNSQNTQSAAGNLFGSNIGSMRPPTQPAAPSLLGATQHAQMNNSAPFGRLSMGQSTAGSQPTVGAVKIDYETMRPTTRFEDLNDSVKAELEQIDKLIQQQESFARQIEAFIPKHEDDVKSLAPDVDYIKNKVEDVEQALAFDAQGVENQRKNADKDRKDIERTHRIITNLSLPQSYQYPNSGMGSFSNTYGQRPQQQTMIVEGEDPSNYDTDLIGNYFSPMASDLQNLMTAYANNLAEIESHMRVIEGSAVAQSQQMAMRKAGINGNAQPSSDETVRELADTLRGFEHSILGVAGVVGECREGVNQLVLGRLGNNLNGMR